MSRARGFTLIELAIVAGLAALLAGLALPSLHQQWLKSRRADAIGSLTRLQHAQERHRQQFGLYAGDARALPGGGRSAEGLYTIELRAAADGYTALAHATGGQSADSDCTTITLTIDAGFARHGPSPRCWNR
jgi:type IV pilus assembly protein PilE